MAIDPDPVDHQGPRTVARWLLGVILVLTGIGHLTTQRQEFQAQVPDWIPVNDDAVVVASGIAEIALGTALVAIPRRRVAVGLMAAAFFVIIFPGNIAQYVEGTNAFGLDTDAKRFARLFFQPVLVIWALWSTGASRALAQWIRERANGT